MNKRLTDLGCEKVPDAFFCNAVTRPLPCVTPWLLNLSEGILALTRYPRRSFWGSLVLKGQLRTVTIYLKDSLTEFVLSKRKASSFTKPFRVDAERVNRATLTLRQTHGNK